MRPLLARLNRNELESNNGGSPKESVGEKDTDE
jgi:hypothetical protein